MTSDTPRRDLRQVEAERVSKLEQRAVYMAEKQAELQIMQELRCRKQDDKTQALKRQCEAQLQSVQQARREAAAKRNARRQEVSSRAKELQDSEAAAREAKVNGLDARRAQAISRLRAEQVQHLEAQKSDKSSKSKELAERLKYVEEQRESAIQQKLRAYEARQVRLESERRVKAEAQDKVKQIRAKCDMWKTYTKQKMAAGKHDELLGEIRDRRVGLSPLSSPSSPVPTAKSLRERQPTQRPPGKQTRRSRERELCFPCEGGYQSLRELDERLRGEGLRSMPAMIDEPWRFLAALAQRRCRNGGGYKTSTRSCTDAVRLRSRRRRRRPCPGGVWVS